MRKLGAALLAIPVVLTVYLASLGRRGLAGRLSAGVGAAAVIVLVILASTPPAASNAVRQSAPQTVSADMFMTIGTAHAVNEPFSVAFDAPMDAASVASALSIEPAGAFSLGWDTAGRILTISPVGHWRPDTLYQLQVDPSARSVDGGALDSPVRAVVLTARAGSGDIVATRLVQSRIRLESAFTFRLDRELPLSVVQAAVRTVPPLAGKVTATDTPGTYTFKPAAALAPDTAYTISLEGLVDADGLAFSTAPSLTVRTVGAPEVVRFRPRHSGGRADRTAVLSVRFTEAMDKKRTASAFSVTAAGKPISGTVSWAEDAHVLVFDPSASLPYDAYVTMAVDATARSRAGSPIAAAAKEVVRVEAKPAPKPKATAKPSSGGGSVAIPRSGGGGGASGSWYAVEKYYLRLMNCTRTGGWVTSSGNCSSPGGRNVAPLALSSGISSRVSRPYAKLLATHNQCSHFIGGNPGDRLRRAGYTSYRWAENIGCRSGGPYGAVLGSHLFFQSEKPYNGGHYRNLMNAAYNRVGIGVWVSGGRVRLVVDFYHP